MKKILLTQGRFALVDNEDYHKLSKFKWFAMKSKRRFYAARKIRVSKGKQRTFFIHQAILGDPPPTLKRLDINHKDGNGLNNRRKNLEWATRAINMRSKIRKAIGTTSVFRGVSFNRATDSWRASVWDADHHYHIGLFEIEQEAAEAFDERARELGWPEHGLNFPKV